MWTLRVVKGGEGGGGSSCMVKLRKIGRLFSSQFYNFNGKVKDALLLLLTDTKFLNSTRDMRHNDMRQEAMNIAPGDVGINKHQWCVASGTSIHMLGGGGYVLFFFKFISKTIPLQEQFFHLYLSICSSLHYTFTLNHIHNTI